jgi:mono/diheme cytochrome c family protein
VRIITGWIVFLAVFLTVALCAQQPATVWDGVYTQAQADRGKAQYGMYCASCHSADLSGTGQAPPLSGADFLGNWKGQSADDLFEKIQTSMPGDQPGKLTRVQNADILAFLFESNGFPAGQKELPSDAAALAKIGINQK